MASGELCKHPTADMCKRETPLSSSGGTKIAETVKTDATVLPRLQHALSVLAFKSWKGNLADVNKVNQCTWQSIRSWHWECISPWPYTLIKERYAMTETTDR